MRDGRERDAMNAAFPASDADDERCDYHENADRAHDTERAREESAPYVGKTRVVVRGDRRPSSEGAPAPAASFGGVRVIFSEKVSGRTFEGDHRREQARTDTLLRNDDVATAIAPPPRKEDEVGYRAPPPEPRAGPGGSKKGPPGDAPTSKGGGKKGSA